MEDIFNPIMAKVYQQAGGQPGGFPGAPGGFQGAPGAATSGGNKGPQVDEVD